MTFNYNFSAPFRYLSSGSSRTACRCRPEKTFLLVAVFAVSLMVIEYTLGGGDAEVQHTVKPGQIVASDPAPYHLTGNTWSIPDLSAPQSGYAFAQTPGTSLTAGAFVTTWRTTTADQSITINFVGDDMNISWGDGITETNLSGSQTHTYNTAGDYTIQVTGGLTGLTLDRPDSFGIPGSVPELASIDQWGGISWTNMNNAFAGASNMIYMATDTPDLSLVTDMPGMFGDATSFNGDLSSWDVSAVTDMSNMFNNAYNFNGDLNSWDVSSVTDMSGMFGDATAFNGNLSSWDVSSVNSMNDMFNYATSFNGNLSSWDVSAVTDMSSMFDGATSFDKPLNAWGVSSVTAMSYMFGGATSFNQPLNNWDVSKVTSMVSMFFGTSSFNQNLGNWYVVANATSIARADVPGVVAEISAQNDRLNGHNPTYGISSDNDYAFFEIVNGNKINMTSVGTKSSYMVNVTASGSNVFESGNNWRLLEIKVTDQTTDTTLPADAFATTWRTTAADESITLPISGSDMTVNWGDGNTATASAPIDHTYNTAGDYTVQITGDLTRFHLNDAADASKLVSLDQWGNTTWTTMDEAFRGADNMAYNAADSPDLSTVTHMNEMFRSASSFNGNISGWDVSSVTNMNAMFWSASSFNQTLNDWDVSSVSSMHSMFRSASSFNQTLNDWDVSSVSSMHSMFRSASSFNQPHNDWDVSSVNDMSSMFAGATSFNQPLNDWDVSSVNDMSSMFAGATSFNQPLNDWDVSSVTSMADMFSFASSFTQNLGEWYVTLDPDTIADTGIPGVVGTISAQNQPLKNHSPTYVIVDGLDKNHFEIAPENQLNMTSSVSGKAEYSVNVTASGSNVFESGNNWRLLEIKVTDQTTDTTLLADAFVTTWKTESADQSITINFVGDDMDISWGDGTTETNLSGSQTHTYINAGNYTVSVTGGLTGLTLDRPDSFGRPVPELASIDQWGGISWTNMSNAFAGASNMIYNATDTPDLSLVTDMSDMFQRAISFDGDLSSWDVSSVTDMSDMFQRATSFDGDLSSWDVSSVTDMSNMFNSASSFNQTLNSWDVSKVTDMTSMFQRATAFNGDLSSWNVSKVTDIADMFSFASSFNGNLFSWDVSSITDMTGMFRGASSFNGDLSTWNVSKVTDMALMFIFATSFNQPLNSWDVSSVTDMSYMFNSASSFNQPLNSWDVSSITDMNSMFNSASSFNQPLNSWDVSSITDMNSMFNSASSFNQPLNSWDVSSVTAMSYMFNSADSFNQAPQLLGCLLCRQHGWHVQFRHRVLAEPRGMVRDAGSGHHSRHWHTRCSRDYIGTEPTAQKPLPDIRNCRRLGQEPL